MAGNIAVITARSGSKGLPDKNIMPLCGKPLLAYSIEAALESGCFEKVFVSTDSQQYAETAVRYGADCSFLRSAENSSDSAGSWDVIREVIREFEKRGERYDRIMLLQPTSPLRTAGDIKESFRLMKEKQARAIVGVCETEHSPIWCNTLPDDLSMENFRNERYRDLPRQQLPAFYRINGAIYLVTLEELFSGKMLSSGCYAYIMPRERSIDIDTELDLIIAEAVMKMNIRRR
ncbi:MAG: acylneuraminate cytidylyltransferase family protein [Ruminococcus sp.]|nr:acylneuraminate cytidylyltransferase family protein [Ruminococcus sp.]